MLPAIMTTVLITGANRGLGLEFVRQYADDDVEIIAACRDPKKADALKKLAVKHKNIRIEKLEVANGKSVDALAKKLKNVAIDVLINNAGIYSGAAKPRSAQNGDGGQSFGSLDFAAWAKVLLVNSIAPLQVLEAFLPNLLKGKERKAINITSKMGSVELMGHGSTAYRSSKAALNAAMRSVADDLAAKKIAWVNLHPGWVKTDMGGKGADIAVETSITGMRAVIAGLTLKNSGLFLAYDGKTIPW